MERYYRTEKIMEPSKLVKSEPYSWSGKNYDIKLFENSDGSSVRAFLGDKPVSSCFHIVLADDEAIISAIEAAKGDVRNGIQEKHNTL